jgi:PAS domain S-box-containing protein
MHWIGPDGIILWANRNELLMLGFTEEEYIGHHIAEFHVDQPVIEDILCRLTAGETLTNYEAKLRCKDGSIREVLINSNVYWEADKFIHTRCFTRDISERKQAEQRIELLGQEAEHRAKNLLATVQAIVHLTKSDDPVILKEAIQGRIQSLANVHSLFVKSRWAGAELGSIVAQEVTPYVVNGDQRIRTIGPSVVLDPVKAQTIAVAIHELVTNAAKYGALATGAGKVRVEWSQNSDGGLTLHWTEEGDTEIKPPTHEGFGTHVLERMISGQLNGTMQFDWQPKGLICTIKVP